ncbi:hypothetical protein Tco_0545203 [Tanacetum coccineum]
MDTTAQHTTAIPKITSGFTTTTPPPPLFFNPLLQQQTPTFTTTTSTNPIVTLPDIPNFASAFKFDQGGRDDQDKDEDPFAGSNRGTKRRKSGKDAESSKDSRSKEKKSSNTSKDASQSQHKSSSKSVHAKDPSHTVEDSGMQQDQEFITGDNDEQPANNQAARAEEPPTSFYEFNDTSFDFSAFVLNRLKIPNLTQEILVRPAFNLLKGTCNSITELEYYLEECFKATTERLDWHNPENKPSGISEGWRLKRRYSTSMMKTKAATYELKWIKDLVPELWSPVQLKYDQHTYFGTSH